MHVLIVEDSETMRSVLRHLLQEEWPDVTFAEADEVPKAFQILRAPGHGVDLILLDLNLPKEPGITLLQVAKRDDSLKDIPIIVVTADDEKSTMIRSLSTGASGYLIKPVDGPMLHGEINRVVSGDPAN